MMVTGKKGKTKHIEILLIEENSENNELTTEIFREAAVSNNINMVNNGVDAMNFLKQENGFKNSVRPNIILLDLNIPTKDGREILKEIKTDPELKYIPIVVMTSSESEQDIINTYEHYANAYITKPSDLDEFIKVIKSVEDYWLKIVELPP